MNKLGRSHALLCVLLALAVHSLPAEALNARSFVSAAGNDANACSRAFPCRTLQVAHDKTIAGGEINMLDVAGYGTVTITKSMSVVNDGVGSAGVLVPAGVDGVTVNAGANGVVNLRGLIIEGTGVGSSGIAVLSAKSVTVQNCVIRNLVNHGIAVLPSSPMALAISDTYITNNGATGIVIQPLAASASIDAIVNRVQVYHSGTDGIAVMGNMSFSWVRALITDTVTANNAQKGIWVHENSCGADSNNHTRVTMLRSTSAFNAFQGVHAEGSCAEIVISEMTSTGNYGPWQVFPEYGATVLTYGDNRIGPPHPAYTPIGKN